MNQIDKIVLKNGALIRARNYLREQSPSDMVAIADVTESIVELTSCHLAAIGNSDIPQVDTQDQKLLKQAIAALDKQLDRKAAADQILEKADIVFGLKPWPPKSANPSGVRGLKPWPPGK